MSNYYKDLYYTEFPDIPNDRFDYMSDINIDIYPYVKEYQNYISIGDFNNAAQVLLNHPELQNTLINADKINRIQDAIKAIQRLYSTDIQDYIQTVVIYQGDYDPSIKYTKFNVVTYQEMAYMCVSNSEIINITPIDNPDVWVKLSIKGDKGNDGIDGLNLCFAGIWDGKKSYNKDAAVSYDNKLFASLIDDNISHTPSVNSIYWTLVVDFDTIVGYDNSQSDLTSITMQDAITEINTKVNSANTDINNLNTDINNINTTLTDKINGITKSSLGLGNVDNTADADKSVKYATTAGSTSSSSYAVTSTKWNGYCIQVQTTDLTPNESALSNNTICFVYE